MTRTSLACVTYKTRRIIVPGYMSHPRGHSPISFLLYFLFPLHFRAIPELVNMPCTPPFYPSRGHEDRDRHDACAGCFYYVVTKGRVRGVFTNSWIARDLVSGVTDGFHRACKTWREVNFYWKADCDDNHPPGGCLPFETVNFSLNPPAATHPTSAPCTPLISAQAIANSSTASPSSSIPSSSSAAPAAAQPGTNLTIAPLLPSGMVPANAAAQAHWNTDPSHPITVVHRAPPRASSSTSSTLSTSSSLSSASSLSSSSSVMRSPSHSPSQNDSICVMPAGSPFNQRRHPKPEPVSPCPKKEEPQDLFLTVPRVTASTRIQLSPTGHARAAALQGNPLVIASPQHPEQISPSPPSTPRAPSNSSIPSILATPAPGGGVVAAPASSSSTPSILSTPAPGGGVVAAPAPAAAPARVRQYGLRGVGIFYSSWAAAHAAAASLGMEESKIMVTDNLEKLEAWITGRPFVGDDRSL
ncbi:hypothetical protein C8R43DRAFT_1122001 [Mycena crocata]|nr:hypothetical protein C8R43DRAFT_1122001 [Mycena crocata]